MRTPPQSKVLAGEESTRQSLVKGGAEYLAKVSDGEMRQGDDTHNGDYIDLQSMIYVCPIIAHNIG